MKLRTERPQRVGLAGTGLRPTRVCPLRRGGYRRVTVTASGGQATATAAEDPLLVKAAKGLSVPRAPCWMMRQAGRYQQSYRDLAVKHPSFRERSETTDLIVEITLQPWRSFQPDGLILFSDILTPLPALGVGFEIDDIKGPIIPQTIRTLEQVHQLYDVELDKLEFVGEALSILRKEVNNQAAVLGFVGSPWTLATYLVEGGSTSLYKVVKSMSYSAPEVLDALLTHLAKQLITYIKFQIQSGAQCVQIFDSWGGQLPPGEWDRWSGPYLKQIIAGVKLQYPDVPLTIYANGSGGLIERLQATGADVVGLDWTVDMVDAKLRLGDDQVVQGNVDPTILFASKNAIESAVRNCIEKAGKGRHILNLGHGVLVGTPEDSVAHMFALSKQILYDN